MFDTNSLVISILVSVGIRLFVALALYQLIRLLRELALYLHKLNKDEKSKRH